MILICARGKMSLRELSDAVENTSKKKEFNPGYDTLIDLRYSDMKVDHESMQQLVNVIERTPGFKGERRTAFVTSLPGHVVIAEMLSRPSMNYPMMIRAFSTLMAAFSWLDITGIELVKYEEMIDELCAEEEKKMK